MGVDPLSVFESVIFGLERLGYRETMLLQNYAFTDWFASAPTKAAPTKVVVPAVAFGQTPVSYESACIGVAHANGSRGASLINEYRALGAPYILEISPDGKEIKEWSVSPTKDGHKLLETYGADQIENLFVAKANSWSPHTLLRAKNLDRVAIERQLGLFDGLVPELEERIQEKLDPLLKETLTLTTKRYKSTTGREAEPRQLFKLIFWMLTAKVFFDRGVEGFQDLEPNETNLLTAVANHYGSRVPTLLNRDARQVAASNIWDTLDFRNLSVEILAQIWSTTLVDKRTRDELGIHRTPRTIVRYMVERISFHHPGDEELIILEPCSGSAVFLVGTMNALRTRGNFFGMPPEERHRYFVNHLVGIEADPFGVEISNLALTLADFPNADGWHLIEADVFGRGTLAPFLRKARVVFCNPPFEDFSPTERERYAVSSIQKPAELLNRVLDDLHPSGVLGFVMPRSFVDGKAYAQLRQRLADRFACLDITELPDRAFEADAETALLVATEPIPHTATTLESKRVDDSASAWTAFERAHEVSSKTRCAITPNEARESVSIPALAEVWEFFQGLRTLGEVAYIHRGIEWESPLRADGKETGKREQLVRDRPGRGYEEGVAPKTKCDMFVAPKPAYLYVGPEEQRRNAYKLPWKSTKTIVNQGARQRGKWRLSAFPDQRGWVCPQSYFGIWPLTSDLDEVVIAAILNSPVANAFVAARERKNNIRKKTLSKIPVPYLTQEEAKRIRGQVQIYQDAVGQRCDDATASHLLMLVDAAVLDCYRLPARIERTLLDSFRGFARPVSHPFFEYYARDDETWFNLSQYLSEELQESTAVHLAAKLDSDR